jgi:hypothetical protein
MKDSKFDIFSDLGANQVSFKIKFQIINTPTKKATTTKKIENEMREGERNKR